jgi:hypothetical protein
MSMNTVNFMSHNDTNILSWYMRTTSITLTYAYQLGFHSTVCTTDTYFELSVIQLNKYTNHWIRFIAN